MSENRTMSVMLFVLGLFLIAVGIGLSTVTQTVTRYRTFTVFKFPIKKRFNLMWVSAVSWFWLA